MPRVLTLTFLFLKCHQDLIYPFCKTCGKLKVPLTMWQMDQKAYLSQVAGSHVDVIARATVQVLRKTFNPLLVDFGM